MYCTWLCPTCVLCGCLTVPLQGLLASNNQSDQAAQALKLICKIFWSTSYMGVPDVMLQRDMAVGWLQAWHQLLLKPVPQVSRSMIRLCPCAAACAEPEHTKPKDDELCSRQQIA